MQPSPATVGQVLLESKQQLEPQVLHDAGIRLGRCGRQDVETGRVYYSPRWKEMLGYRDGEIGGRPDEWLCRVHPDDFPRLQAAVAAHCRRENPQLDCEHRIHCKDGTFRWVLSRGLAQATTSQIAGATEVVFAVEHVRAAYDALRGQGVEFVNEPRVVSPGNYAANFRDPDGHLLSVFGPE